RPRRDVALAVDQALEQAVSRGGDDHDGEGSLVRVFLVQIFLQLGSRLGDDAPRSTAIVVEQRGAVGYQRAESAVLGRDGEVAGPRGGPNLEAALPWGRCRGLRFFNRTRGGGGDEDDRQEDMREPFPHV